jgi:FkbM family methyltransferase
VLISANGCARRFPDFIIIGAAKSGTTSLYFYLRQHPAIFMSAAVKEPAFFCFAGKERPKHPDDNPYPFFWNWVIFDEEPYSALFEPAQENQLIGEATPEYLYLYETTIANLKRYYRRKAKDLKLIAILRNPIDRAWSHYSMACRDGYESLPFDQATETKTIAQRLSNGWHPSYDYIGFGFYAKAIAAYREEFGANLKVILVEDLANDASGTCAELFRFLGFERAFKPDVSVVYNASGQLCHPRLHDWLFLKEHPLKWLARSIVPYDRLQRIKHKILAWNSKRLEVPPQTRARLLDIYRSDIKQLEKLIERDLSSWLQWPVRSTSRSLASNDSIMQAVRRIPFAVFGFAYKSLARTPLRRIPGMLRLSNVALRWMWFGGNVIDVQGAKMYIELSDPNPAIRRTFQAYLLNLVHERATTSLFQKIVHRGDVVLDLGANLGYFTLLAAQAVGPQGRVFSFEPEPKNFQYLKKNIEINEFNHVTVCQAAVSDKNDRTKLFLCPYDSGHHTIDRIDGIRAMARGRPYVSETIEIETVRMDDFLRKNGIAKVDVIKMDVEGAEALALEGMPSVLSQDDVKIFMEFFPLLIEKMGGNPFKCIERLLNEYGFSIYVINHDYGVDHGKDELITVTSYKELVSVLGEGTNHANLLLSKKPLQVEGSLAGLASIASRLTRPIELNEQVAAGH